jgi:hypothetical protein
MPSEFEFNSEMLLFIADHVHTCKYGTFFFNSDAERRNQQRREKTISIWMEIELAKKKYFMNPHFV